MPDLLQELKALSPFPPMDVAFSPEREWKNVYRIWTCHGYRESGNANRGFLTVERKNRGSKTGFTLTVNQTIANDQKIRQSLSAEMECRADALASPVRWKLSSRFTGPDGREIADLQRDEEAKVDGEVVNVLVNGNRFQRKVTGPWTSDWCLLESIQRLPFKKQVPAVFCMLEELSLSRPGHRIFYKGLYPLDIDAGKRSLHWFQQTGQGILPYDYWIDESHRLMIMTTLSVVYILDEKAPEKVDQTEGDFDE